MSSSSHRATHVYGGLLLASFGVGVLHPPAGVAVFGAALVYLGLRWL